MSSVYKNSINLKDQYNETPDESMLMRYLAGTLPSEEKQLVEDWANNSAAHQQLLARMAFIYEAQQVQHALQRKDAQAAFQQVYRRVEGKARIAVMKKIAVAAAILIGLFGLSTLFITQKSTPPALLTVTAQKHALTTVTLPDGTTVSLSAGSSLSYPATMDQERQVTLHGKGYFDVAPNAKTPFQVKVGNGDMYIHVLGTTFNLEEIPQNRVQATLVSGSIELTIPDKDIKKLLKPTEKAVYLIKDNSLAITKVNTDRELDWLYNRLVFRKTPMKDVLDRLSDFYDVRFDVKDQAIMQGTFTGTFEDKPLLQVLEYIKIASKISYTMENRLQKNEGKPLIKLTKQHKD